MFLRYVLVIHKLDESPKYTSVAFPTEMVEAIRDLIKELKYWPSASAFAREAVLEKIRQEKAVLKEVRKARGEKEI
ncbi:hypothetical protein ES703_40771 [subsurface metagenome]